MTTPQLIEWLDAKMVEHGDGKLMPPDDVIEEELEEGLEAKISTFRTVSGKKLLIARRTYAKT